MTAEYDGSGNMLKRYVHGAADGEDDPLVEYIGTGTSPRYLFATSTPRYCYRAARISRIGSIHFDSTKRHFGPARP